MIAIDAFSSQPNCSLPKFIAPRHSGDTRSPDRPRFLKPVDAILAIPPMSIVRLTPLWLLEAPKAAKSPWFWYGPPYCSRHACAFYRFCFWLSIRPENEIDVNMD